jgi:hypothetical protein
MTSIKPPTVAECREWIVTDADEDVVMLRHFHEDVDVMVCWDAGAFAWSCSEHGVLAVPNRPTQAVQTCVHIQAGLKSFPRNVAARLGADLITQRKGRAGIVRAADPEDKAIGEARAAIARAEATAHSGRHSERDERHRRATSEVAVRQMTDADRARLAERRAAKKRTYEIG